MLEELRLRGLGVIDDALLELGPGFTAITGETGAGKTMLLTGLGLLLGSRGDAALVRPGHERAEVEGRLRLAPDAAVLARVHDAGGVVDDEILLVARSVSAEGRSRAHLGGRSVPVGVLGDIADDLVAVHGQADQRGLLRPAVQRGVLDRYAGAAVSGALADYRALFARLSTVQAQLLELTSRRREQSHEAELLRFGLAEIDAVAPQPGEDRALRLDVDRLAHVEALRRGAVAARSGLAEGDPDGLTLIAAARRALDEVRGRDGALDALASRLADVSYLLADISADLASYADGLAADPIRLETAQQRLAQLATLTRKYAPTSDGDIDGVIAWAADARVRLGGFDDGDRVGDLSAEHDRLIAALTEAADALSAARTEAARRLEAAATEELGALAMAHARVHVLVRHRDDPAGLPIVDPTSGTIRRVAFGASGIDDVEILLESHPGAPARPLHRGASGGELSRVMLALEVVLAGCDPVSTFVFDEVDAGVGGRAAVELGRRLAALARSAQVIVVTHLPQVAAFADRHLVVRKSVDGTTVSTAVHPVDGAERLEELARMLAGLPDSALGRGHAEELLAVAAASKKVA